MQSFGGPFHSKTGLIEGCNRKKCVLVICLLKRSAQWVRFPTQVTGSSLAEIIKTGNTNISN